MPSSSPLPGVAHPSLSALGFTARWPALLSSYPDSEPGRVVRDDRGAAVVVTATGERRVPVQRGVSVVTGDWVALAGDVLMGVLDRSTAVVRPRSDGAGEQVLAANVDLVGVVHPLDAPLRRRRLERGVVLAYQSGAIPVVVLTKADAAIDLEQSVAEAQSCAPGIDVVVASIVDRRGLDGLVDLVAEDRTLVLLGASGAGKSSLINALVGGDVLDVGEVRAVDRKGRHTTTRRELVALPSGGCLIDTPGLRALALGAVDEGMALAFPEIEELAADCRFGDCSHQHEPGCAVLAAVENGTFSADRYEGWRRIEKEAANAALREDQAAWRATNRQWGRIGREAQKLKNR